MRKKFIAGNWKMNKTVNETIRFFDNLLPNIDHSIISKVDIAVFPPFLDLYVALEKCKKIDIIIGAQNMYYKDEGAYTGEISPVMLKESGVNNVIIGHSERRCYFNDSDNVINEKMLSAISHNINPILCIGETEKERQDNKHFTIIERQIKRDLFNVNSENIGNITIAYEPIWAIGTGNIATPDDADEMHKHIRHIIEEIYDNKVAENLRILYGGSVKPNNSKSLLERNNIDGALIGGASLKPDLFLEIIKSAIE